MKNKKVLITLILLFSLFIQINTKNENKLTINTVEKITYYSENNSSDYEVQQAQMMAVKMRVKGDYDQNIKSTPLTCKVKIERLTKIIYMDGDEELGSKYIIYKDPAGELMVPSKKGYDFVSWTNSKGELITENSIIDSTEEYRIYANWSIIVSELTVDPNGGTWNESVGNQTFNLEFEATKEIADPERIGYTFTNWQVTGSDSKIENKVFTMGIENSILKAIYNANEYELTINPNSGTYKGSTNSTKTIIKYDSVTLIEDPIRVGYTFTGWTVSNGTLNGKNFVMNHTGNVTLTANWQINNYKYIVYHKQQSTDGLSYNIVSGDTENGILPYQKTIKPEVKTYTGFTSPSQRSLTIQDDTDPPTKNILNYEYSRKRFNLIINPNGGSWNNKTTNSSIQLYYQQTSNIANPTRTGYNFVNWQKNTTDSTLTNQVFKMGLTETTMTAQWNAINYRLIYNVNGGLPLSASYKTVTYDQAYGTLPTPQKSGYHFNGWYNGTTKVTSSTVHKTAGNVTIKADWANDPPVISSVSIKYIKSGISDHGTLKNGSETAEITVRATDTEDGTPTIGLSCYSGRVCDSSSLRLVSQSSGVKVYQITLYQLGAGVIEVTATDKAGATVSQKEIIYVYSEGSSLSTTAKYTNTTYDSGWLDLLEGCYISDFTFNVKFTSEHYNGSNTDSMLVEGKTETGAIVTLYEWTGNMEDILRSSNTSILNNYNNRYGKIRQIKFRTYSPHSGCASNATITYSVHYKFDLSLLD